MKKGIIEVLGLVLLALAVVSSTSAQNFTIDPPISRPPDEVIAVPDSGSSSMLLALGGGALLLLRRSWASAL